MLYITLIITMLTLKYKKENKIRYKSAKRRFKMEIINIAIVMIIVKCGERLYNFKI